MLFTKDLIRLFYRSPVLPGEYIWLEDDMTESARIQEAYIRMATGAKYRPEGSSDGVGNVDLTAEAGRYAARFIQEENGLKFFIGCSNWSTNRALVYTIEAARVLCGAWHLTYPRRRSAPPSLMPGRLRPPSSPPSGPRSMIQSALRRISMLCSMTMIE